MTFDGPMIVMIAIWITILLTCVVMAYYMRKDSKAFKEYIENEKRGKR